jgi:hypothetical protein
VVTVENDIVAGAADFGAAVQTAGTNAQGVIQGINDATAGLLSGGSAALEDVPANLQALLAGPAQFLQGVLGVFGQDATNQAYAAAAAAAAAQAAELAAQQSAFNAVFNVSPVTTGNVSITVDFSVIANQAGMSGIMSPGTGSGNGFMGVTSGEAKFQGGVGDDVEVFPTATTSDYQVAEIILGSLNNLISAATLGTSIFFRVNSARDTYGYLTLFRDSGDVYVQLGCVVAGVGTVFAMSALGALSAIASGGRLRVVARRSIVVEPVRHAGAYNGTPLITYTDSSHISQMGGVVPVCRASMATL